MNTTTLYTVKGHKGAHTATMREVHPADQAPYMVARVHLVGAILGFDVAPEDITPFTLSERGEFEDIYVTLAQEATTIYNLDPKRIQRATEILRSSKTAVQVAKRDANGETIATPSYKTLCVKGSKAGWYVVTQGACTCKDHANGHTCKHRIAAWMKKESIARPIAAARNVSVKQIITEVMS